MYVGIFKGLQKRDNKGRGDLKEARLAWGEGRTDRKGRKIGTDKL